MSDLVTIPSASALPVVPRTPIHIRAGTMADVPFMDALQKKHSKQLGYFPTKQFEGYIQMGGVLVAEGRTEDSGLGTESGGASTQSSVLSTQSSPLGYIIYRDRYLKRDELGVVFQLAVSPGVRRGLVGAALVKAAMARSAYGCRLFCCWCAQDLEANHFWESLGFVPLAFRVGSLSKGQQSGGQKKKPRIHIFWQRRIVDGDAPPHATPWWYPFQTGNGAIRADRVVLPIPAGTHWSAVRPPDGMLTGVPESRHEGNKARRHGGDAVPHLSPPSVPTCLRASVPSPAKVGILVGGKMKYVDRPAGVAVAGRPAAVTTGSGPTRPAPTCGKRAKPAAEKIDPAFLAAARELRDRYLEHANGAGGVRSIAGAKYDVSKTLPAPASESAIQDPQSEIPQLPAPPAPPVAA